MDILHECVDVTSGRQLALKVRDELCEALAVKRDVYIPVRNGAKSKSYECRAYQVAP